ncbi:NUDIX hydrolase [Nocardia sp. 2YAB30]|uniref:NUDIX hydrolase n=1 Tax=Nocardia sp. 2YAB30 TaxID=3233022 RepID=UPI003F9AACDA
MSEHQIAFARMFVVNHLGQVLLVRDHFGYWNLPGGKVEPGEKPAAAAVREMSEETGLTIVKSEEVHHDEYEFDGVRWAGHFYWAQLVAGRPELQEPDKATELAYRDPSEAAMHPVMTDVVRALMSRFHPELGPSVTIDSVVTPEGGRRS